MQEIPGFKILPIAIRIGRGNYKLILPYIEKMLLLKSDHNEMVRLSVIWASENITIASPELFHNKLDIFEKFLSDELNRVRIEAPEMFRVLGKRKPEIVKEYKEILKNYQ